MDANLVLFKKDGSHRVFSLPSNVTVIGRRDDCDLCVPLADVSRRHCQLNCSDGVLSIRDLGSHNGTFVNGERIQEVPVHAGDYLRIGPLTFMVRIDGEPKEIAPPKKAEAAPPKQAPKEEVDVDEFGDSFADLEDSGSFLDEIEDL
ncbi:MAG: FHA domain-containing protein [Phycisphaerales bacterium]|nr:MAG: FHA domain-containing protein [Phycisphaerales bacterium]